MNCKHVELNYHPDPSGNNDSYYTCSLCGIELSTEDHRKRDTWIAEQAKKAEEQQKMKDLAAKVQAMLNPVTSDENLIGFLEMAGAGCISGAVVDWPQLKPACRLAHQKYLQLVEAEKLITKLEKLLACGADKYVPAMADALELLYEHKKVYPNG